MNSNNERSDIVYGVNIPIDKIVIPDWNFPVEQFEKSKESKKTIEKMKQSIIESGLINAIVVKPNDDGTYLLLDGRRRLETFKELGKKTIPATVSNKLKNVEKAELMGISLLLNSIEMPLSYHPYMTEAEMREFIDYMLFMLRLPDAAKPRNLERMSKRDLRKFITLMGWNVIKDDYENYEKHFKSR
jgi:hypothetical protein